MIFAFIVSFFFAFIIGSFLHMLYVMHKAKKIIRRNERTEKLIYIMIWYNRMGLYETKEILGPKLLGGSSIFIKEMWKEH